MRTRLFHFHKECADAIIKYLSIWTFIILLALCIRFIISVSALTSLALLIKKLMSAAKKAFALVLRLDYFPIVLLASVSLNALSFLYEILDLEDQLDCVI